ncbi:MULTISPECIES: carbohydrate ABC transporter permease [Parageobacillus]|uniref:Carbohydrate ABC transporter membrane protein 1, CUT1 family n=1 Tax=Parageobacillus thermantarcticus TaxID=186116 RepID=A0A1I0TSV9_9BACL|nr:MULTISPECIES: sugar ABC transporter permease [Parageobacillus]AEH46646.1 ABC-type transporter, integral membrane subunit [Parageobacillus thermoglucosidasius C56-YS93]MBY6268040.1 sugar ABC transporter permease [Parageobacillus thermoglucosidasius]SFA54894.1 carbohydrate ABC transporter membrane protein 1, CUT1 family [Parageobacillus thermantarcticus]
MGSVLKKWKLPAIMLGPFIVLIFLFFFLPVVLIAILAFTSMDSAMRWDFNGLANFQKLVTDPNILLIVKNTVIYVGFTLLINVFFGLVLGILTTYFIQKESVGLFFRTIWMLPRISPPVVYVLLWLWFFDPSEYGVLNSLRAIFHMPPKEWLTTHPMVAVILANGLIGASFGMIIFSSAIKSIPKDLFYAANVDGASQWSIIKDIIIPAMRWPLMFVTLWQFLSLLTSYEYILLLTNGGPLFESEVLALYSYHKAFRNFEFGYGSAISLVLVLIALIFSFIMWKLFGMKKMMGSSRIE